MSLLAPVQHALAAVVAGVHSGLTSLGADPSSGATWCLSIAAVVVIVRTALLPLVVHGVRNAHAAARARPHLKALAAEYRGRTDAEAVRAQMAARREISAEHGMSRLGCLPLLLQVPIWIGLYHLLRNVADGQAVGALDGDQVASLARATIGGVHLTGHGYLGSGSGHLAVVLGLAGTAAVLSFVTQRYLVQTNSSATDLPESMATAQRIVPFVSAGGMLLAGGVVPVALLFYWACGGLWTFTQSAVVWRFFPTPGSPAAARRAEPASVAS
ncbi:membrane protein insertase YidC [Nocardioides sp.]|uniref:membrane protein insertase YidC n=1 Tax=Nocardioides sp. TaxID=35761 RepID=UPI00271B61C7|nr:membrane protein insertase YidC [Nocardioides sp.]MDO9455636.1 membrane protein insertase YidC [Nocardioides sp.]